MPAAAYLQQHTNMAIPSLRAQLDMARVKGVVVLEPTNLVRHPPPNTLSGHVEYTAPPLLDCVYFESYRIPQRRPFYFSPSKTGVVRRNIVPCERIARLLK
jgi:hypothetical protein